MLEGVRQILFAWSGDHRPPSRAAHRSESLGLGVLGGPREHRFLEILTPNLFLNITVAPKHLAVPTGVHGHAFHGGLSALAREGGVHGIRTHNKIRLVIVSFALGPTGPGRSPCLLSWLRDPSKCCSPSGILRAMPAGMQHLAGETSRLPWLQGSQGEVCT